MTSNNRSAGHGNVWRRYNNNNCRFITIWTIILRDSEFAPFHCSILRHFFSSMTNFWITSYEYILLTIVIIFITFLLLCSTSFYAVFFFRLFICWYQLWWARGFHHHHHLPWKQLGRSSSAHTHISSLWNILPLDH